MEASRGEGRGGDLVGGEPRDTLAAGEMQKGLQLADVLNKLDLTAICLSLG